MASSSEDNNVDEDDRTKQGRWTVEEHSTFVLGLEMHGKEWKKIATMIPTRTVVQIRTHAQKYFQKNQKESSSSSSLTNKLPPPLFDSLPALPSSATKKPRHSNSHPSSTTNTTTTTATASATRRRKENQQRLDLPSPPLADFQQHQIHQMQQGGEYFGVTPRTVAAATILLVPSRAGMATNPWLEKNLMTQMQFLDTVTNNNTNTNNTTTSPLPPTVLTEEEEWGGVFGGEIPDDGESLRNIFGDATPPPHQE